MNCVIQYFVVLLLTLLIKPYATQAQYVLLNLKADECTNCSKNFSLISDIKGDKFLVFGTRYQARAQVLNKRFQEYISYNSIIYNDSLAVQLNQISEEFTKNVIVYDKEHNVVFKCHYNDLNQSMINRINQLLRGEIQFELTNPVINQDFFR